MPLRNPVEESQRRVSVTVGLDDLRHVMGSELGSQPAELRAPFPLGVAQNVADSGDQVRERFGGLSGFGEKPGSC